MTIKNKSIPKVFILESLDFDDEKNENYEGEIIYKILRMSSVECEYCYFRTQQEFEYFLQKFKSSNFRYLHLSCHATSDGIYTTLGDLIKIDELSMLLENVLDNRRLFLSACSLATDNFSNLIFKNTYCYSIVGAYENINMNDAAIFWASFYHLLFNRDKGFIKHEEMKNILYSLMLIFKIPLVYYKLNSMTKNGWSRVILKSIAKK